jgi:hypothetical protein
VCDPAINDAPSYRVAEAPLDREVQREILTGAAIDPLSRQKARKLKAQAADGYFVGLGVRGFLCHGHRRDQWPRALLWQGRWRLGRQRRLHRRRIDHRLQQQHQQRLAGDIEWAFLPNWSAKVEYNYLGLDDRTFTVPAGSPFLAGDTFTQSNRSIQMVKVGINYLFNSSYCVPADPACLLNCRCRE